jgi:hypothetical protein
MPTPDTDPRPAITPSQAVLNSLADMVGEQNQEDIQ